MDRLKKKEDKKISVSIIFLLFFILIIKIERIIKKSLIH
jgi:hypothetical protein